MNREELWKRYTDKNPHWLTKGANFTPKGLHQFFNMTWNQGYSQRDSGKTKPDLPDIFNDIFK